MDVDLGQLREPCACGMEHNIDVEKIVIESGAVSQLEEILEEFQNPVFICDSNTRTAAEPFLEEEFKDYPVIELNPEGLQADNRGVNKVMKQLDYCDRGLSSVSVDVLVAIGGGTIHDLTRYAATEYDIPFVSIPTAASVDGYAANVAALTWDGLKRPLPVCLRAGSWQIPIFSVRHRRGLPHPVYPISWESIYPFLTGRSHISLPVSTSVRKYAICWKRHCAMSAGYWKIFVLETKMPSKS